MSRLVWLWRVAAGIAIALAMAVESFADDPSRQTAMSDSSDEVALASGSDEPACDDSCAACLRDCSGCCDPLWIVRGGAVILHRSNPSNITLFSDAATGAELLNAKAFNFGWNAGPDIAVWRRLNPSDYLEVRFFDVASFSATQALSTPGPFFVNTMPPVLAPASADINAAYTSSLFSTEINFRRRFSPWGTWLAGFRTLQVRDDLNFHAALPALGVNAHFETDAHNFLYGAQTGFDMNLWNTSGPFQLHGLCKAGVYGNAASQATSDLVSLGGGPTFVAFGLKDRGGQAAFVGEIGLTGIWQWTDRIWLRGGYQLLWIDGLALATNQIPSLNIATQAGLNTGGWVFYHGALAGLEFCF
jgi:hypothetical protein